MESNKKATKEKKLFIDGDGNTWDKDGNYVEIDDAPGSLMDFINRTSRGEDPEKVQKECELAEKQRQEKIDLARKTGNRVEL